MAAAGDPPPPIYAEGAARTRGEISPHFQTYARDDDAKLETTRARLSNILKRHEDLKERLSRDSDKLIFERLQKEFEAARAAQTEEISINDDEWNDGLLATIREKVHMEADRKAMSNQVIYCLDGARIGIQYETFFAGEPCEIFHCVLESKSFLEKMIMIEHTLPFFLPVRELESDLLSSNSIKFIDHLEEILQAYIDRREQVRLIKELYGNQIGELFHSLPYNMIEFVLEDFECKVTISIRYSDLLQTLPSQARVLAWPLRSAKKISTRSSSASAAQPVPFHLSYAEEALKTLCLPEAYADIVLELPHALKRILSSRDSD
ncbi:centromere protein O isoform X3 [Zea mays]|uniref:centromere protein O isoform X3 n=1 Tax=Zea mays TaxID=4577 RepID=UPI0004DEAC74|nr:centromere protein O isoform X3 [Zea mays]|eukprot:XP_008664969.1 centromere protein O isoform X3 [Zea mays]